jgi:outer membrane lipoprotein-sorting protein
MKTLKILIALIVWIAFSTTALAQKGKSKELLDEAKKEYKKAKNVYLEYQYSKGAANEFNGKIYIKGDNYYLISNKNEQYFDGKNLYTILHQEKEITISKPKNEIYINPTKILELYEKGYRFKSLGLVGGISTIQLIPIDPTNKITIEIGIHATTKEIKTIKELQDGVQISGVIITVYKKNLKLDNALFVFNKAKFKGYYTTNLAQ